MGSPSKAARQAYYQRNREAILAEGRLKYQRNKEQLLDYQREYRKENAESIRARTRKKRHSRLLLGIEMLGGCCAKCKGVFDPCQYDFHHTDPTQKEFTIGENLLVGKERFINEINKCILLCANCHRLEHKENYS